MVSLHVERLTITDHTHTHTLESLYNAYEQLTRETNNNVSNPGSMTHHPTFMANNNSNSHQTAVKASH